MTDNQLILNFQKIEDELNSAYELNDAKKLSDLLAEEWTILEPSIGIVAKSNFLNAITEKKLQHQSMKKEVISVKAINDMVLVISQGKNIGKYLGKHFDTEIWVTNIYKKINSKWLCVFTQEAPVMKAL